MSNKRKVFLIVLQVLMWTAFIALPYFTLPRQSEGRNVDALIRHYLPQPEMAQNIFLSSLPLNLLLIFFFYIHHYVLFNRFFVKRRFVAYVTIVTGSFLSIFAVFFIFKRAFFSPVTGFVPPPTLRELIRAATWFMLVLLVSLGIKLSAQWQQAEERTRAIENEQLRTELSFLHAQINPHFLFNSLNAIYSLALKKADAAPIAVLKLSHLLRYVIDEASNETVPLEKEVNYLNNYIELQKLRSTASLIITFKVAGDIHSTLIAPLLLLPFVENAFKYGISNQEDSPIDILLTIHEGHLVFKVKNRKFPQSEKHSTGIGINNVQRRLELLYPDKHELEINDSPDFYSIKLFINLL